MEKNVKSKAVAPKLVETAEDLAAKIAEVREAQRIFANYTQEQVDKIFFAAAMAANKARIPLAKMAVAETGMGIVEDKVIKNHYASEYIYNAYRDTKTCGVIEEDASYAFKKVAEPVGLVAAVIPTTNPTSTAIFKTLISLKTRNGIIISPHPRAKGCTIEASRIVLEAAVAAGAPAGTYLWVSPLPQEVLDQHDMVQLKCSGAGIHRDLVIYHQSDGLEEYERQFIEELKQEVAILDQSIQ